MNKELLAKKKQGFATIDEDRLQETLNNSSHEPTACKKI